MPENPAILTKQPGGWTLIVLLIVVAIIALLMMYYLPSVLQMYSPPSSPDQEGTRKPIIEHVKERLAPIDQRNKQLEDFLDQPSGPQEEQTEQDQQDDYEE